MQLVSLCVLVYCVYMLKMVSISDSRLSRCYGGVVASHSWAHDHVRYIALYQTKNIQSYISLMVFGATISTRRNPTNISFYPHIFVLQVQQLGQELTQGSGSKMGGLSDPVQAVRAQPLDSTTPQVYKVLHWLFWPTLQRNPCPWNFARGLLRIIVVFWKYKLPSPRIRQILIKRRTGVARRSKRDWRVCGLYVFLWHVCDLCVLMVRVWPLRVLMARVWPLCVLMARVWPLCILNYGACGLYVFLWCVCAFCVLSSGMSKWGWVRVASCVLSSGQERPSDCESAGVGCVINCVYVLIVLVVMENSLVYLYTAWMAEVVLTAVCHCMVFCSSCQKKGVCCWRQILLFFSREKKSVVTCCWRQNGNLQCCVSY